LEQLKKRLTISSRLTRLTDMLEKMPQRNGAARSTNPFTLENIPEV
jgi:hypothetical protein